jgi:hypothetical protein
VTPRSVVSLAPLATDEENYVTLTLTLTLGNFARDSDCDSDCDCHWGPMLTSFTFARATATDIFAKARAGTRADQYYERAGTREDKYCDWGEVRRIPPFNSLFFGLKFYSA